MSTIKISFKSPGSTRLEQVLLFGFLPLALTLLIASCGPAKEAVCEGDQERLLLVPSTSESDLAIDRELAPTVAEQVVSRAANSCGSVTVGTQNNRATADMALQTVQLTPDKDEAFNRNPEVAKLEREGNDFVDQKLLQPLAEMSATKGSPFFASLTKIGDEMDVHGLAPATVVLVGDGIAVEKSPSGKTIDFSDPESAAGALREFVPLLRNLKGSCVILVGAGAGSGLSDQDLRTAQDLMGRTLGSAGAGFVATRSPDIPDSCHA